jgi:carbon storage regulator CsrA
MLVLTRKTQQQIKIGSNITITIVRVTGQAVRVGIEAPEEIRVVRGELIGKPDKNGQHEVASPANDSNSGASSKPAEESAGGTTSGAPLAARCRNRMKSHLTSAPATVPTVAQSCVEDRRRVPGASFTSMIRRPQRLGPASVGGMLGRLR